jgi:hypothetical protein
MRLDEFKIGNKYSYAVRDNVFTLIGLHENYLWVLWVSDREIETLDTKSINLKIITQK